MGKKIILMTDIHGLLVPLEKCLEEIKKEGATAIYCLGDAIGDGPSPEEVLSLLRKNKVTLILGNQEYYKTLGMAPFIAYLSLERVKEIDWTNKRLSKESLTYLNKAKDFEKLTLGGKKIGLCHFAGDVRVDWLSHGQAHFQKHIDNGTNGAKLFCYTNSEEQKAYLKEILRRYGEGPYAAGVMDVLAHPLFDGQSLFSYDAIFEGHIHFEMPTQTYQKTSFYTLRSLSIGYKNDKKNMACYYVLEEVKDGFTFTRKNVFFDRDKMLMEIEKSDMPFKETIYKYVGKEK